MRTILLIVGRTRTKMKDAVVPSTTTETDDDDCKRNRNFVTFDNYFCDLP